MDSSPKQKLPKAYSADLSVLGIFLVAVVTLYILSTQDMLKADEDALLGIVTIYGFFIIIWQAIRHNSFIKTLLITVAVQGSTLGAYFILCPDHPKDAPEVAMGMSIVSLILAVVVTGIRKLCGLWMKSAHSPSESAKALYKRKDFYFSVILGTGLLSFFSQLAIFLSRVVDNEIITFPLMIGVPMGLFSGLTFIHFLYKSWAAVHVEDARTTPGKAIGFLFIPIYSVYWIFQVIPGLATDLNKSIKRSGIKGVEAPFVIGVLTTIFSMFAGLPYVNLVLIPLTMILSLIFVAKVSSVVIALQESVVTEE